MTRITIFACVLLCGPGLLFAQLVKEDPVKISYQPADHAKAGQEIQARVVVQVKKGWHLFSQKPEIKGIVPTKLTVDPSSSFTVGKVTFPAPDKLYSPVFEKQITVYQNTVPLVVALKVKPEAGAEVSVKGQLEYQACSESLCMPPGKKVFSGQQKIEK